MDYKAHKIKIINFDEKDIFVGCVDHSGGTEFVESVNPGSADK